MREGIKIHPDALPLDELREKNSDKGGSNDKRCMMEARLEGHQPMAVTDEAETIDQAIEGAVVKLKRLVDHTLGRLNHR